MIAARSDSSASADSNTCNCDPWSPFTERVPERTQRVDERLERQLHPDEVDRPAEQHLETLGAGC